MSKYKNIFPKDFTTIIVEKPLWLKKIKMLFGGHMLLMVLTEKKLLERLTKTNCKENQKEFRTEKVIKKKGDKFYVK